MSPVRLLESRLGGWAIASRQPVIVVSLILVGIAASGTRFLEFSADNRIYLNEDNPQLLAFDAFEDKYGQSDNVLFVLVPPDHNATSALALEATTWLTEQSWTVPYVTRVDSLTNFPHTTAHGDDILVRELIDVADSGDAERRARIREIALAEPSLAGRLIARDGGVSGVHGRVGGVVTEPRPPQTRACATDALGSSPDRFAQGVLP